jgi:hypothetical protein
LIVTASPSCFVNIDYSQVEAAQPMLAVPGFPNPAVTSVPGRNFYRAGRARHSDVAHHDPQRWRAAR